MSIVYVPGQASELPFEVPQDKCCNCGGSDDLKKVTTQLKKTRYMVLGGTELTFNIDLPYCGNCAISAGRLPVGAPTKLLVAFGIFWALMLVVIFVPNELGSMLPGALLPSTMAAVALGLSFTCYAMRRPVPPQTSYYQPVSLAGVRQKFSGEVVEITLRFANAPYSTLFQALNQELISSGALKLIVG